jgi:hypothetical protein
MGTQIRGSQIKSGTVTSDRLVGTDIATVGTITTGTWHGSVIGLSYLDNSIATQSYVSSSITALNLGTMSTQNANNVAITGGTISGLSAALAITDGGTGATTASGARTSLGLAIGSDVQAYSTILDELAAQTYAGSSAFTTLGTVTTGVWHGTPVDLAHGGTGANTASDARSSLGLAIGSDVQAYSATLDQVSAGTYAGASSITTLGTITTGVWHGSQLDASYVPSLDAITAPAADVSMANFKLTNLAAPASSSDAATKGYVDTLAQGVAWKAPVMVAAGSNVNVSNPGTSTINSYTLSSGDRVLLFGQTAPAENGIYVFNGSSSAMTRATDADSSSNLVPGSACYVEAGNNANKAYVLSTTGAITLGSTALTFVLFTGLSEISVGNGLTKSGSQINVVTANGVQADGTGIHLKLDGTTLTESSSGVKVSAGGITTNELHDTSVTAGKLNSNVVATSGGLSVSVSGLAVQFAMGEQLTGTVDGSNTSFSIANTPASSKVMVFRNGMLQVAGGTDYTLTGTSVSFASAPASGDDLRAVYFY